MYISGIVLNHDGLEWGAKRSWLGYKSHLKIRYCSEYIMFQVYLDLSYHGGTMMALMFAKVGVSTL